MRELFKSDLLYFNHNLKLLKTEKGLFVIDTVNADLLTEQVLAATIRMKEIKFEHTQKILNEVIEIFEECLSTSENIQSALIEESPTYTPEIDEYVRKRAKSKERTEKTIEIFEQLIRNYKNEIDKLESKEATIVRISLRRKIISGLGKYIKELIIGIQTIVIAALIIDKI